MPFFVRKQREKGPQPQPRKRKPNLKDIEVSSDSEEDALEKPESAAGSSDSEEETVQAKRRRLAQAVLAQARARAEEEAGDGEEAEEKLRGLLADQVAAKQGRLQIKVAERLRNSVETKPALVLNGHRQPPVALAVSSDGSLAASASKDGAIIKWDLRAGKRLGRVDGRSPKAGKDEDPRYPSSGPHCGAVNALALSSDDKYLCSGGADKKIQLWDFATLAPVKAFGGHRGPVTGLVFRHGTQLLFSVSADKTVKVWSMEDLAYVDTMFGHQDGVESVDALGRERFISAGGRDRSLRIWKVAEESQLLFLPHRDCNAVDCVRLINEEKFVSGADDGSISLWSVLKKKPLHVAKRAHGGKEPWLSALAPLRNADLLASGSGDGVIKLWKIAEDYKTLELLLELPVTGFVNDLRWAGNGALLAAVGQEHRKGRWWREPKARNTLLLFRFPQLNNGTP